ncbi:MAG: hypothetical protein MUF34_17855 [Polyangiaceae bacterium]|jgi:uncharacterized membrane protein|nr:hypothetical protein [Polyangiaceae bacterium]
MAARLRSPALFGAAASVLGIFFAAFSTHDYAQHLDRQLHGTHCSFVPGLSGVTEGPNACTAAMYSPYSAVLRGTYWGGLPISLFALGAYAFFLAASVYLLSARDAAPRSLLRAYGVAALLPLPITLVMAALSALRLGGFCKLCVGLYVASALLALAGFKALRRVRETADGAAAAGPTHEYVAGLPPLDENDPNLPPALRSSLRQRRRFAEAPTEAAPLRGAEANEPVEIVGRPGRRPLPPGTAFVLVFALLGLFAAAPALVYAASLPDYRPLLANCGKLAEPAEPPNTFARLATAAPRRKALLFVDPLCPTCKALHERLAAEGALEQLDASLLLFPLDNECNWMLDRPVHAGACVLAKAVLCGDKQGRAREVLEWAYAEQEALRSAGKAGKDLVRARVRARFAELDKCLDERETQKRLERGLHFAVANKVPVSTPQLYLGELRVCDEDTDLGLRYTLGQLAPEVLP